MTTSKVSRIVTNITGPGGGGLFWDGCPGMCFYFHHLVFECIPFLCVALDGEIAGEWVTGAPTQQWGNHWRTLGVKGGFWWRWCLGSCLGIPQTAFMRCVHVWRSVRPQKLCAPDKFGGHMQNISRAAGNGREVGNGFCRRNKKLTVQTFTLRFCRGPVMWSWTPNLQQLLFVKQHHLLA